MDDYQELKCMEQTYVLQPCSFKQGVGKLSPATQVLEIRWKEEINKPRRTQNLTRFGQYPCLRPHKVSPSLIRELHKYKITLLKFIPNPSPCIQKDTPCTPSLNLEDYSTPRVIRTLEHNSIYLLYTKTLRVVLFSPYLLQHKLHLFIAFNRSL